MQWKKHVLVVLMVSLPSLAQNAITNPVRTRDTAQPAAASFGTNNANGILYSVSNYNWSQHPPDDLSSPGTLTIHLSPCPSGIDTTGNMDAPYGIYISGKGMSESVPVIGTRSSCPVGSRGTIKVITRYPHTPGYTVGSASGGNQEAINSATAAIGGSFAIIQEVPAGSAAANYNIYWPVFLSTSKTTLLGDGALWNCYTRSVCLLTTSYSGANQGHNVIRGLSFAPATNVDGALISSVSASSGIYTVTTTTNHNLVAGDWIILYYTVPAGTQEARVQVLTAGLTATQFEYNLGTAVYRSGAWIPGTIIGPSTTFSASSGFGWVALEDAAIEVESDGTKLVDIRFSAPAVNGGRFHHGVVVGNDQDFAIDGMAVLGGAFRADANFTGEVVYIRGDQGAAGIPYISHLEASMQCGGNGIRNVSGNTMSVRDSVIQGNNQYSIYYGNGLNPWEIDNVYTEQTNCSNYSYPNVGSSPPESTASFISNTGQPFTIQGNAPIGGQLPVFTTTGPSTAQRNYFVVARDTKLGISPMLFIGTARPATTRTSIPLYWPNFELTGSGIRTWDIIVTIGSNPATAPYTGNANYVATRVASSCSASGICTYTDTQAALTAYTVPIPTWVPSVWFWPAAIVLGRGGSVYLDRAAQAGSFVSTTYLPAVFAKRCADLGSNYYYAPIWTVCQAGDSVGNGNPSVGAQLLQMGGASGSWTSGITGVINLNPGINDSSVPRQVITTMDGSPQQTFATPGYVRQGSAKDSFIGTDTRGSVGTQDQTYGAPGGHYFYVNDAGTSGTTWSFGVVATGPELAKFAFASLPACNSRSEGELAAVTDSTTATWGATITGSGPHHVLAYCDGTHWTVMAD